MMINAIHPLHVLLVFFLLCMKTSSFGSESLFEEGNMMRCSERERKALLVFKQGVSNEHDLLHSWKKEEEDCCKWKGVGCDNRTGHVTHLYLSSPNSPFFMNLTSFRIGHSLLDLPYLNYLDLSMSELSGLTVAEFIGSLTKLVHLDLSDTKIKGSIPDQIGNHSNLQYLNLSNSEIDPSFFDDLGNLSNYLNLRPIPKFIGSLNSLRYLDLSSSWFTGVIPHELGNLSKLQYLSLSFNNFDGPIPKFIGSLHSLRYLDLSDSSSTGVIPHELGNLSKLQYLNLSSNNFDGPIPKFIGSLHSLRYLDLSYSWSTGVIPHELGNLSKFQYLDLANADVLTGALEGRVRESFGHMTALTYLDLSANQLNGEIPNSFGLLTALTYLDLSANQLNGEIPKSICNLPSLEVVHFSFNNLTGSLPDFTLLSSLMELNVSYNKLNGYLPTVFEHHSALQLLDLSNNHLRGSLPDFTGFSSLEILYLDNNEFSGSIPNFTGSLQYLRLRENQLTKWESQSTGLLSHLVELDLSMNSFHGTISEAHLSNLSSLKCMRTSFNSLTFEFSSEWLPPFQITELSLASCKLGPKFPNWIRNQRDIYYLDISNNQISDTIPIWFWSISRRLSQLNLSSNKIRGKFSYIYDQIEEIDLSSNYFDGPLPPIPADCIKINLSQNKFSGTLLSLGVVKDISLFFLDISHNQLFGALPDNWMHFKFLGLLNLGYNNISGRIPSSIGNLVSLRTLILRNNKLYGELPASLRNCSYLEFVDFGLNKLSGKVPSWIGEDLHQLYSLILKSNRFYGSLPYEICHLSNLHFLDLSINRVSGTIPPCFGYFTAMIQKGNEVAEHIYGLGDPYVHSYTYSDVVLARWKGQELEYGRNFAYLKMIDLSTNKLTGEIPIGITRLLELKGLNLSGNRFYGKVPPEIGQLKELECLDLSTNKFSGEIPLSMSGLNFLGYLDISNNNFSGRIPSGTQLQGFNISTYEGNTGLCGRPLTNICPGDKPVDHVQPSSGEYEVDGDDSEYERWLYINAVLGFSTTFGGFIGTLVLNRRWRHAYFLFLEHLKERFYVAMVVRIARLQRKV